MEFPLEIVTRDQTLDEKDEQYIRDRGAKLNRFYDRILGCRVVVQTPHRSKHKGVHYQVGIQIMVPGEDVYVNRAPGDEASHEDLHVAIRDAFDTADRLLRAFSARRRRGEAKAREA